MKIVHCFFVLAILLSACQSAAPAIPEHTIQGEWVLRQQEGGQSFEFIARFRPDGTYEGIGNGKLIVSGTYRTLGDTMLFRDAICNEAYEGLYKINYFSDSMRFSLIKDTCTLRVNGTNGYDFKRVK